MGERKVINKYYPPDFNPALIPQPSKSKNGQMKVRNMLPMSIRCQTCSNYMYKGTKSNHRKEEVIGETYLGIKIFRFYFKCTNCSAEIIMRTDPQNNDYTIESGALRNFEPWRREAEVIDGEKRRREDEEIGDKMKSLENRSLESKREMDILSGLGEMKSMNSIRATVSLYSMLENLNRHNEDKERKLEEEDEALIKSVFRGKNKIGFVRRVDIDDDSSLFSCDNEGMFASATKKRKGFPTNGGNIAYLSKSSSDSIVRKLGAGIKQSYATAKQSRESCFGESNVLLSLGLYGSDDEDE